MLEWEHSLEDVELNSFHLGLDALPSHEYPGGLALMALEQPLPDAQVRQHDLLEVARAAVVLDHPLHDAALEARAVASTVDEARFHTLRLQAN